MFSDKYLLTKAVLEGRKTMTRRNVPDGTPLGNWEETEKMSRYNVGELVAVAQSYKDVGFDPACNVLCVGRYVSVWSTPGWSNKMFVHPDHMKHFIRITNVRVERLQDISDEDCLREGVIEDCPGVQYSFPTEIGYCGQYPFETPREAFAALIDRLSGKGTWKSNPWVFVYEFELVK